MSRESKNRMVCKICQRKQSSGLLGYKVKNKKTDDDKEKANGLLGPVKSSFAGLNNVTAVAEIISMCVVLARLKPCNSQKQVRTFALLDSCYRSMLQIKY